MNTNVNSLRTNYNNVKACRSMLRTSRSEQWDGKRRNKAF